MTDAPLPDDELASAVVDGLAGDQELARLRSDPALAARVEQLRAVRQAVARSAGDVPAPSPAVREQAITSALAAATAAPRQLPPDAPTDLAARREQRARRPAWLPAAAAAAVVAVLGLGAFAALRDRGTGGDSNLTAAADAPGTTLAGADDAPRDATFEAAGATTTAAAGGGATSGQSAATTAGAATTAAAAPPPTAPAGGAPSPTVTDELPDLGPIDSADALRGAVVALPPGADGRAEDAAACTTDPSSRPVARLLWIGQPALVLVVDGSPSRALVVTVTDCQPLAEVPLP